jgi:DNA repair exonuclease SbcCD ATPase subunit
VALERVVRALTPLSGLADIEAFEDYLKNMSMKVEVGALSRGSKPPSLIWRTAVDGRDQTPYHCPRACVVKLLPTGNTQVDARTETAERIEDMRDTHRLESKSQSEQIAQLKSSLEARDLVLRGFEAERNKAGTDATSATVRIAQLEGDVEKARTTAREEEEKRIKSVSLLKALRQKLVKAEKDKEEAERDRDAAKASGSDALSRLEGDVQSLRANQEQQLTKLRLSYERETNQVRAQYEREAAARKGQAELEVITLKAGHAKELSLREARVTAVEGQLREATAERGKLFDQLQLRQAEVESTREDQDRLAGRTSELEYELREARDRATALSDELDALRTRSATPTTASSGDVAIAARQLVAEAEAAHAQRVTTLEARIKTLERERAETEEDMARQLQDRLRQVEDMRADMARKDAAFAGSVQTKEERQARLDQAEARLREAIERAKGLELMLEDARTEAQRAQDHQVGRLRVSFAQNRLMW